MCYKPSTLIFFFMLFFCAPAVRAQNDKPVREIGLQFSGLNFNGNSSFSVFYKKQKKENVFRRIRFTYGSLGAQVANEDFAVNLGGGIAIGREKRKTLDPKLEFYQGPEFSAILSVSTVGEENTDLSVQAGFGWVLGLQHSFNARWAVNLETIPRVNVNVGTSTGRDVTAYGLSAAASNTVSLGLLRRF